MVAVNAGTAPRNCLVRILSVPERETPLGPGLSRGTLQILTPDGFVTLQVGINFRDGATTADLYRYLEGPLLAIPDNASEAVVFATVWKLLVDSTIPMLWKALCRHPA